MSADECAFLLDSCYTRAMNDAPPCYRSGIRRAFRAALRAASNGDAKPTVLILARYP